VNILIFPILIPAAASLSLFAAFGRKSSFGLGAAPAFSLAGFLTALLLCCREGLPLFSLPWLASLSDFSLKADPVNSWLAALASFAAFLLLSFCRVPTAEEGKRADVLAAASILLMQASACGLLLSDSLAALLLFSVFLSASAAVSFMPGTAGAGCVRRGKMRAAAVFLPDALLLCGVCICGCLSGSLSLSFIRSSGIQAVSVWPVLGYLALFSAAVLKTLHALFYASAAEKFPGVSGTAPFACSLLSVISGLYILYAACFLIYSPGPALQLLVMACGAAMTLYCFSLSAAQTDIRKIISCFLCGCAGFSVTGFGCGSGSSFSGGLIYLYTAVLAASGLFIISYTVSCRSGSFTLSDLRGGLRVSPALIVLFLLCVCALIPVFPFGGFTASGLLAGGMLADGDLFFAAAAVCGHIILTASVFRLSAVLFSCKGEAKPDKSAETGGLSIALALLPSAALLFFGFGAVLPADRILFPALLSAGLSFGAGPGFSADPFTFGLSAFVLLCGAAAYAGVPFFTRPAPGLAGRNGTEDGTAALGSAKYSPQDFLNKVSAAASAALSGAVKGPAVFCAFFSRFVSRFSERTEFSYGAYLMISLAVSAVFFIFLLQWGAE